MKRNIVEIKKIINTLLRPVGPLSKEFAAYDPVDKPILCYEQLLYILALWGATLAKVCEIVNTSISYWPSIIACILIILAMVISLLNLLLPPRFSISRLAIILVNTIWLMMLISPRF